MSTPSIAATADGLAQLARGERAWFWFCAGAEPALVLSPVGEDPGMAGLLARVGAVRIPADGSEWLGLAAVDDDGRVTLGSETADAAILPALAAWVRLHHASHPGLARLAGAAVVQVDAGKVVRERWEDEAAWSGLVRPPAPARGGPSADEAGARLAALTPGEGAWYWLAERGPAGRPHLAVGAEAADPDGTAFAGEVRRLAARSADPDRAWSGYLRVTSSGRCAFTTEADPGPAARVLSALAPRPCYARLADALVLRTGGGGFTGGAAVRPMDRSRLEKALAWLAEAGGDAVLHAFFVFGEEGAELVLNRDPDRGREAAQALTLEGQRVAATLGVGQDGRLEIRGPKVSMALLGALAGWAALHVDAWPGLRRLAGTRAVRRERDAAEGGEVFEDAGLWTAVGGA